MRKVDPDAWVLAAEGELGDVVCWQEPFKVIKTVQGILCSLEEVGDSEDIDWDALIGAFDYFRGIQDVGFPPLYNEWQFGDAFDDFLCLKDDDDDEDEDEEREKNDGPVFGYRPEFVRVRIYIDTDKVSAVVSAFNVFLQHLRTVPQLREAGLV
jgi:hypothetical protein